MFKCLEQIQIEGTFKLRKVFSSRSLIPIEFSENNDDVGLSTSEIEAIPKNLDYSMNV